MKFFFPISLIITFALSSCKLSDINFQSKNFNASETGFAYYETEHDINFIFTWIAIDPFTNMTKKHSPRSLQKIQAAWPKRDNIIVSVNTKEKKMGINNTYKAGSDLFALIYSSVNEYNEKFNRSLTLTIESIDKDDVSGNMSFFIVNKNLQHEKIVCQFSLPIISKSLAKSHLKNMSFQALSEDERQLLNLSQ